MSVVSFGSSSTAQGINSEHVIKVTRKDGDESTLLLSNGTTVVVPGTVAEVIAKLNT